MLDRQPFGRFSLPSRSRQVLLSLAWTFRYWRFSRLVIPVVGYCGEIAASNLICVTFPRHPVYLDFVHHRPQSFNDYSWGPPCLPWNSEVFDVQCLAFVERFWFDSMASVEILIHLANPEAFGSFFLGMILTVVSF